MLCYAQIAPSTNTVLGVLGMPAYIGVKTIKNPDKAIKSTVKIITDLSKTLAKAQTDRATHKADLIDPVDAVINTSMIGIACALIALPADNIDRVFEKITEGKLLKAGTKNIVRRLTAGDNAGRAKFEGLFSKFFEWSEAMQAISEEQAFLIAGHEEGAVDPEKISKVLSAFPDMPDHARRILFLEKEKKITTWSQLKAECLIEAEETIVKREAGKLVKHGKTLATKIWEAAQESFLDDESDAAEAELSAQQVAADRLGMSVAIVEANKA